MIQPTLMELNAIVDAYEEARHSQAQPLDLRTFVPPQSHPQYYEIVTELVRVDMECSWDPNVNHRIEKYRALFPEVLSQPDCLSKIAYEEYRLRSQTEGFVDRQAYRHQYGIDVGDWPPEIAQSQSQDSSRFKMGTEYEQVSKADPRAAQRLAEVARILPQPGEQFGEFEIIEELGRGAFAHVFLARQSDLAGRLVAIKIGASSTLEPQRLAQLQHTNIVPVYSVHRYGPAQAICMPYFGRTTLADILRSVRTLDHMPNEGKELVSTLAAAQLSTRRSIASSRSEKTNADDTQAGRSHAPESHASENGAQSSIPEQRPAVELEYGQSSTYSSKSVEQSTLARLQRYDYVNAVAWIVARIADGLSQAHQLGIVHRDLKPANVLLADSGQPLILDFNVASEWSITSRQAAMIGGTLPYMSPEQLEAYQGGGSVDPRSDIYSLGVILFEMLTGRHPFSLPHGSSDENINEMVAERRRLPSVRKHNMRVSPGLESIVHRCLSFDAAHRYQNASELVEDLDQFIHFEPLKFAPERSWSERTRKWTRRHPRLSSSGSIVALTGILIMAGLIAWERREMVIKGLEASRKFAELQEELPEIRAGLGAPGFDRAGRQLAIDQGLAAIKHLGLPDNPNWMGSPDYQRLEEPQRQTLRSNVGEILSWIAQAKLQDAQHTTGPAREHLYAQAGLLCERGKTCFLDGAIPESLRYCSQIAQDRRPLETNTSGGATDSASNPLDEMNQVYRSLWNGDFTDAGTRLEGLTQTRPRDFAAWFWLGQAYWGQGRADDAEACFSVCVAIRPLSYLGYFNRGLVRLERKMLPGADSDFSQCIQLQATLSSSYVNRGIVRQQLGHHEGAVQDFDQALTLNAPETRIYFLRSRSAAALGDYAAAKRDLDEGMTREPSDQPSWLARGYARLPTDPHGALEDFKAALNDRAVSVTALQMVANVLSERLNRNEEAVDALDQLSRIQPNRALWHSSRSVLLARSKQKERAFASAKRALSCLEMNDSPESPYVRYQIGCCHALLSESDPDSVSLRFAIACLRQSFASQVSLSKLAENDSDLGPIRNCEEFQRLLEAALNLTGKESPQKDGAK